MGLKTVLVLFAFGATIASGQFMPRLLRPTPYDMSLMPSLRSNGCPSGPELAPVICQFMEPNMGLFKPQLIAPSTFIPPLVVEKCDTPQLEIEFPPQKPIVIPEAPILPPIMISKFPVPVIEPVPPMPVVEALPLPPMPPVAIFEPCEPASIAVSGSADVSMTGVNIPAAPVLPPLEMPALPEIVELHGASMSGAGVIDIDSQSLMVHQPLAPPALVMPAPPMFPCPEDEPIPIPLPAPMPVPIPAPMPLPLPAPIPDVFRPLTPVPAPPMLPPARLPEIPVHVGFPQPMVPSMVVEEPCITGEIVHHHEPVVIAQPPMLPHVPMPILPAHEPAIIADPCEPSFQPVMKLSRPPYFVGRLPPYMLAPEVTPALYPGRRMLVNKNVPLPAYMRRI